MNKNYERMSALIQRNKEEVALSDLVILLRELNPDTHAETESIIRTLSHLEEIVALEDGYAPPELVAYRETLRDKIFAIGGEYLDQYYDLFY